MRPLKIVLLHSENNASFQVRCQTPLLWLKEQRAIEVLPQEKAWEADLVFLHGMQGWPGSLGLVRSLQRSGIRVVADMDADLLSEDVVPEQAKANLTPVREFFKTVDALTAPTVPLASALAKLNTNVLVTPNGLNLKLWQTAGRFGVRTQARTVGFAGTISHLANVDMLRPVLAKMSHEFKVQGIRFVCMGFRPLWLSNTVADAEVVDVSSPQDYPALLNKLRIDVALAPLVHCDFERNRSPLKFYEYAAAGAVTIASNFGPFADAIEDGVNGLLVDNQPESWIRAIGKLIKKGGPRLEMLEAARRTLEDQDVSKTAPRLLEAFEAVQPKRDREFFAFARTGNGECGDVDVVIPVDGSTTITREAIEAVIQELDAAHRLVLIDDGSTNLLDEYTGRPWVTVRHDKSHGGFRAMCNLAVAELTRPIADVILMKPDTLPMPGFVRRLAQTAGSHPAIGTVTAVSNNGSFASVPNLPDAQELGSALGSLVVTPVAATHLLYIKRQALRKFGALDEEFASDAAAETDFSMRLSGEYTNVIDTGCWCRREASPPFRETVKQNAADQSIIDKRYPHAKFEIEAYFAADPMMLHRRKMIAATRDLRPRVLQVAHTFIGGGGTEKHVLDLEAAVSNEFLSFGAAPHEALALYCGNVPLGKWPYENAGWPLATSDLPSNDQSWINILNQVKPDLIHFHHLLNHPLSLLAKLTSTGIPVIVSLHDYYFFCPDFHLHNCPGVHSCETCFPERFKGPAQYQALRRDLLGGSLKTVAALVAPSVSTANLVREVYPDLNIRVIPHGIRGPEAIGQAAAKLRAANPSNRKIRFGMMGNLLPVKGIEVIFKVWPMVAREDQAELHIYGASDPLYIRGCEELGIHYHGPYREADLPEILSQIDVGIMPAQVQETFSYALSEFFAGGVPVIGSDYGALGTRIENGVNGLKVPPRDIDAWVDAIRAVISDAAFRERITQGVRPPDSIADMAGHYAELYREVIKRSKLAKARGMAPSEAEICGDPVAV